MTKQNQVYKCEVCGNITEVLHAGGGELVCCGQPMKLMEEKTEDQGQEKHVPVIEADKESGVVKVKVGEVDHPMEQEHYIEWIEIVTASGQRQKKFLNPGEKPEAQFFTTEEVVSAREYCNLHGLWSTK